MPVDLYDDEEDSKEPGQGDPAKTRFKDFDCPTCNANNPCDPPIATNDEVLCNYCGSEFQAQVTEGGRLRLREI